MKSPDLLIIGSGIVATAVALRAVQHGLTVEILEKGPELDYPHLQAFQDEVEAGLPGPRTEAAPDLKALTQAGDYRGDFNRERIMVTGGSATRWGAALGRLDPHDFQHWPLSYDDLEPFYCEAEALLGASGNDQENPFAPPRSRPYPLPPFELTSDLRDLNHGLKKDGLELFPSPQARTRHSYDGRPGCQNNRVCITCPIGARYSPNHHLQQARATGLCRLRTGVGARRILLDAKGRARAVVFRPVDGSDQELSARVIVLAAGAVESARLLLLSSSSSHPHGLGNGSDQVGRNFMLHHCWPAHIHYPRPVLAGRMGADGGHCRRFVHHEQRHRKGGILVQMRSEVATFQPSHGLTSMRTPQDVMQSMASLAHCQVIHLHAESRPDPGKRLSLSRRLDRFGDPLAHIDYRLSNYDLATWKFAQELFERFARASGGEAAQTLTADGFVSAFHHMGCLRMSAEARDGVVDARGRAHGVPGLFVLGGAVFADSSAIHPTLTMVAHALYSFAAIQAEVFSS